MERMGANDLLAWLVPDAVPVDGPQGAPNPLSWPGYDQQREQAAERAGVDESVQVARGASRDGGSEAVVVAWEFGFLGGSMGSVAGQRIANAYDHAREQGLPIVLLPSTGGARMQEGMASLVQMAATTVAARAHADAGLLQVAWLRHPTTGGVFASHANLADVILAEPSATIGFAGPRVSAAVTGHDLPEGSHTAEGARAAGLVDAVVARKDLPSVLSELLAWPGGASPTEVSTPSQPHNDGTDSAWAEVERARDPDRPRAPAFLDRIEVAAELHGDRAGFDDPAIQVVLARIAGRPAVVLAMDPGRDSDHAIGPAGYRKAWRGIALANRLEVPIVTLVDTPGADASATAEAGGVAHHIAETFRRLLAADVPVVSLVIGQGGSGGALALAVGDRLLMQEHAIFSVIAPEGAAAILHRDSSRAAEVTELLDPTAHRLVELGIADQVVPEPDDDPVATAWSAVVGHLDQLMAQDDRDRRTARDTRWRKAGAWTQPS